MAEATEQYITIVNPVRISTYTNDPAESLGAEYKIIHTNNLPATWLLTYDAIKNNGTYTLVKTMNKKQELGIFLEVSSALAQAASVKYHNTGFWHHANAVFLIGYTQEERIKIIDTVFEEYKKYFGNYPSSVGSWWTDSFSLNYMQKKYGIVANLTVSDQFSTDGYQVWGTYWSTPYYPSSVNNGFPASKTSDKLDVVNIQWAPRDPYNGYFNSLYSTQDYGVAPQRQETSFFEKIVTLYGGKGDNKFGQVTVGLESDLDAGSYEGEFSNQINSIKKLVDGGLYQTVTMAEFGNWYKNKFRDLSPAQKVETKDLLGKNIKVTWYQSPNYRIGVSYNYEKQELKIFDLRNYSKTIQEPYYFSPDRNFGLFINIPSYFDELQNPQNIWIIKNAKEDDIKFFEDKIVINKFMFQTPNILNDPANVNIKRSLNTIAIQFIGNNKKPVGILFEDYTSETKHYLGSKKNLLKLLIGKGWNNIHKQLYFVGSGELDVLYHLSKLPNGRVLVNSKECLQCEWHTKNKPDVFANIRSYVKRFGEKLIVQDSSFFKLNNRQEVKKIINKLGIKYIYLVKFEYYEEKIPFSPGDLGVEKVYSNANAEIWKVK
ncbi:hypothetical protein HY045_03160 [Candidatus Woesebacteria bacterium]|nr:hypothetical protein [Candidatus Woesebacteria bacterium]